MDEAQIIATLRIAFADDNIKREVLTDNWYDLNIQSGIDSTGFCFAASEVLYRLTGGKDMWIFKGIKRSPVWNYGPHCFLMRKGADKKIVDITEDQYTARGIVIPYDMGKGRGLRVVSNCARILTELSGLGEI